MTRRLGSLLWLTVVWIALWEELTWANTAGGLLAALVVTTLVPPHPAEALHTVRPLALARLVVYFGRKLIEASALVLWEVITPGSGISPGIVGIPLRTRSLGIVVAVANMVTLTPGTLTLEVDRDTTTIYIHVLHLRDVEEARRAVLELEEVTMAAFPLRRGGEPGARTG